MSLDFGLDGTRVLQAQLDLRTRDLRETEGRLRDVKEQLAVALQRIQRMEEDQRQRNEFAEVQYRNADRATNTLKQELVQKNEQIATLMDENRQKTIQVTSLTTRAGELTTQIATLTEEKKQHKRTGQRDREELANREEQIRALMQDKFTLEKLIQDQKHKIAEAVTANERQAAEFRKLTDEAEERHRKAAKKAKNEKAALQTASEQRARELLQQNSTSTAELRSVMEELIAKRAESETLRTEGRALADKITQLEQEVTRRASALNILEDQLNERAQVATDAASHLEMARHENQALRLQIQSLDREIATLQKQRSSELEHTDLLAEERRSLADSIKLSEKKEMELSHKLELERSKAQFELERVTATANVAVEQHASKLSVLESRIPILEEENGKLRGEVGRLTDELKEVLRQREADIERQRGFALREEALKVLEEKLNGLGSAKREEHATILDSRLREINARLSQQMTGFAAVPGSSLVGLRARLDALEQAGTSDDPAHQVQILEARLAALQQLRDEQAHQDEVEHVLRLYERASTTRDRALQFASEKYQKAVTFFKLRIKLLETKYAQLQQQLEEERSHAEAESADHALQTDAHRAEVASLNVRAETKAKEHAAHAAKAEAVIRQGMDALQTLRSKYHELVDKTKAHVAQLKRSKLYQLGWFVMLCWKAWTSIAKWKKMGRQDISLQADPYEISMAYLNTRLTSRVPKSTSVRMAPSHPAPSHHGRSPYQGVTWERERAEPLTSSLREGHSKNLRSASARVLQR